MFSWVEFQGGSVHLLDLRRRPLRATFRGDRGEEETPRRFTPRGDRDGVIPRALARGISSVYSLGGVSRRAFSSISII